MSEMQSNGVSFRASSDHVDIAINGAPFTAYRFARSMPKPVLYPLRTVRGTALTRGFPLDPRPGEREDHPHHIGLWFNHGDVNGIDFWNMSDAIPEAERKRYGVIRHREIVEMAEGAEGVLRIRADWMLHDERVLLEEGTRLVFREADGCRCIDRCTELRAMGGDVVFNDSKEGMYGVRVRRELEHPTDAPQVFKDSAGRETPVQALSNEGITGCYRSSEGVEGEAVWGTRARWMKLGARVDDEPVTLAILDHPKNPGAPTYWQARGYGLFAANPLGQAAYTEGRETFNFKICSGDTAAFRFRMLIASADLTDAVLEQNTAVFGAWR